MVRGLYISASSTVSEIKRIDTIANNVANVNTTGFKKDIMITRSFPEVLISKLGGSFPDKDILRQRGPINGIETEKDSQRYKVSTNTGFFNVQTNLGVSNSRSIQFEVDEDGYLVTPQGNYILGNNGVINVGNGPVDIDNRGQVLSGGSVVGQLKISNPLNVIGNISAGVHVDELVTDFTQGHLEMTDSPMDFAIEGKGFFVIEVDGEERYSRDGSFTLNSGGYLVTKDGHRVLGENGYINLNSKDIRANERGELISEGELIDRLKLKDFKDYKALRKEGDNLYIALEEDWEDNEKAFDGIINQGFIEASNVNSVKEMVEMISMLRTYESNQRLIKAHDELLEKAVNEVGRV